MTVGFVDGLVSGSRSAAWRAVVVVIVGLFALGVGWTARKCLVLRTATVADLRTRRRGTSGVGTGVGLVAAAGTALAAVVVVVTVAAVFGGALTLLVFSLDRYAIGEPGARRQAGLPV